jgi:2'-5' RNA ligase
MPRPPVVPGPAARGAAAPLRMFYALWPDGGAGAALATMARDAAAQTQGRAVAAENLHMTLAFLGDVAAARVAGLHAVGAAAASAVPPFALALDRIGTFRGAGIAWAGASEPPAELLQLVRRLGDALAADGFAIEKRAFHPHVTLARRCRRPASVSLAAPIGWTVARLTLNASDLSPAGPRYRELAGWTLAPHATGNQSP